MTPAPSCLGSINEINHGHPQAGQPAQPRLTSVQLLEPRASWPERFIRRLIYCSCLTHLYKCSDCIQPPQATPTQPGAPGGQWAPGTARHDACKCGYAVSMYTYLALLDTVVCSL